MTQEEKQLLLKALCAMLPYGVICTDLRHGDSKITEVNTEEGLVYCFDFDEYITVENCHLYLRPMTSMTEEEKKVVCFMNMLLDIALNDRLNYQRMYVQNYTIETFDYFNEHKLDYRGLIPMGLALEAPDGMYKIE